MDKKKEYIGQIFKEQTESARLLLSAAEKVEDKQDEVCHLIWDITDQADEYKTGADKIAKAAIRRLKELHK